MTSESSDKDLFLLRWEDRGRRRTIINAVRIEAPFHRSTFGRWVSAFLVIVLLPAVVVVCAGFAACEDTTSLVGPG